MFSHGFQKTAFIGPMLGHAAGTLRDVGGMAGRALKSTYNAGKNLASGGGNVIKNQWEGAKSAYRSHLPTPAPKPAPVATPKPAPAAAPVAQQSTKSKGAARMKKGPAGSPTNDLQHDRQSGSAARLARSVDHTPAPTPTPAAPAKAKGKGKTPKTESAPSMGGVARGIGGAAMVGGTAVATGALAAARRSQE